METSQSMDGDPGNDAWSGLTTLTAAAGKVGRVVRR